jgi:hypothetical protein
MKSVFQIFCFLFCFSINAQTVRDKFILDSIEPYINSINLEKEQYYQVKKALQKIEKEYGYEPDFKYRLLNKSYAFNDIPFFKDELSILVEKYGFNIAYMSESETYFESITNGNLKEWFKQMYLDKHFIWLKNNFDKQIDLRKLNELRMKDQLVNGFSSKISQIPNLDSIQKKQELEHLNDFFYANITDLYKITQKWSVYPTGKSFALVQNNFGVVEFHNNQAKKNFDSVWPLFYQYYKKAYLNHQITYMNFRNHDNFSFLHYGFQEFGLISIKDIPSEYRKNEEEIPVKDIDFMNKTKKEFKW